MPNLTDRIDSTRTTQPPPPRRRYRLVIDLEADSIDALHQALETIGFDLLIDHADIPARQVASGGRESGWTAELTQDLDVTHDSWRAAVDEWLAARKAT